MTMMMMTVKISRATSSRPPLLDLLFSNSPLSSSLPSSLSHLKTTAQLKYPNLLERFDAFVSSLKGKRLALFLDYDGTLTPIVRDPDRAFLSDATRAAVKAAAAAFPAAIVSGRGREKVEQFVRLPELYYAGSHGMDIVGPAVSSSSCDRGEGGEDEKEEAPSTSSDGGGGDGGKKNEKRSSSTTTTPTRGIAFRPAAEFAPVMDALHAALVASLVGIPGSSVEHNTFCVSVRKRKRERKRKKEEKKLEGKSKKRKTKGNKNSLFFSSLSPSFSPNNTRRSTTATSTPSAGTTSPPRSRPPWPMRAPP